MADDLSFEEFQAIEQRNRAKKKSKENKAAQQQNSGKNGVLEEREMSGSNQQTKSKKATHSVSKDGIIARFGVFLEMHEMQAAVSILLLMDTFAAFYLMSGVFSDELGTFFDIWHRGLRSFLTFALFFFVIEMCANIIAFNFSLIGHFGYLLDLIVIAWQVYFELEGYAKSYKLLNIFRLWRVLRLFYFMLDVEKDRHEVTKEALVETIKELDEVKERLRLAEDDIEREKEARGAVEEMLQNYKEEVDTLNEALKIAAMDIAEVAEAEDDFFSSDEDETAGGPDEAGFHGKNEVGGLGSERDSKKNKDELYRLAVGGSGVGNQKKSTIVIRDDGTFEHK